MAWTEDDDREIEELAKTMDPESLGEEITRRFLAKLPPDRRFGCQALLNLVKIEMVGGAIPVEVAGHPPNGNPQ